MKRFYLRSRAGFTLVELLVVVAIIGVLATIGVPTFQKMIEKSKKSEAKVALGALYTTETAFFSEYGVYGNNITAVGFTVDGTQGSRTYSTGFPGGVNCSTAPTSLAPINSGNATALYTAYPTYSTVSATVSNGANSYAIIGGTNYTKACIAVAPDSTGATFLGASGGYVSNNASAPADVWTMDNTRTLANVSDGVY